MVRVLEDAILATDLALFFKRRKETLLRVRAGISWQVNARAFPLDSFWSRASLVLFRILGSVFWIRNSLVLFRILGSEFWIRNSLVLFRILGSVFWIRNRLVLFRILGSVILNQINTMHIRQETCSILYSPEFESTEFHQLFDGKPDEN